MKNAELYNETNSATYCPEDDKLRLYVGRVPRPEYDALRAEGWQATAKQDCDFSAVWSVEREDTAISYAGVIDDEDTPPQDRAADRAERFAGYLDGNLAKAEGHADRYDDGPAAHGYQSKARAVRAADRHDRIGSRAVNCWDKAEYWQSRTAGVISNALHRSSPGVRMGRIKTIEAELRKAEKSWKEHTEDAQARFDSMVSVVEHAAGTREKVKAPASLADFRWELSKLREKAGTPDEEHSPPEDYRRAVVISALTAGYGNPKAWEALAREAKAGTRPAADIAAEWLQGRTRPEDWTPEGNRGVMHLKLRIAYELQMLDAQGGRAALVEMVPGGFIGGHQIHKVNKSPATGRVVSVALKVKTNGCNQWGRPDPTAPEYRMTCTNIERLSESSYRAPTPEELEAFHGAKKAEKAAAPKSAAPPLINPTPEDAERLQALFNARYLSEWTRQHGSTSKYYTPKDPGEVQELTQAQYSAASKGSYARHEDGTAPRAVSAYQLFQTPQPLAARMVELADIQPGMRVLEPSAGLARLLLPILARKPSDVVAVEVSTDLCRELYAMDFPNVRIMQRDFLETTAADYALGFDRIVMNPPFHMRSDLKHVRHALTLLRPGGKLVGLCLSTHHRETALRALCDVWEIIPAGAFRAEGTNVETVLFRINT